MRTPLTGLSEQLGQPKANQVPDWITTQATSLQTSLSNIHDNADAVLSNPSKELLYTNMKDINDLVTKARRIEVLVKQMIASLKNL